MAQLVEPLSDAYSDGIAQYFSALEFPTRRRCRRPHRPRSLRTGQQLLLQGDQSRQLPACGPARSAMTGVCPTVPGLLGLPRYYLNRPLGPGKPPSAAPTRLNCMKASLTV